MTRKRFIKLLMSKGMPRNYAEKFSRDASECTVIDLGNKVHNRETVYYYGYGDLWPAVLRIWFNES